MAKVWFSFFTPQRGATDPEILSPAQRSATIEELRTLRQRYAVLDMHPALLRELETPPQNPDECIFARTTQTISADLKTAIKPCQFGGDPDCANCGCIASMGLAAVGHHRVAGKLTAGQLFFLSDRLGKRVRRVKATFARKPKVGLAAAQFNILEP